MNEQKTENQDSRQAVGHEAVVSKPLRIFCFSDGDELWADYSLEETKKNFKEFCGLDEEDIEDAFELDDEKYDELKVTIDDELDPNIDLQKITYREYLKEFTEPGYFACSADLC